MLCQCQQGHQEAAVKARNAPHAKVAYLLIMKNVPLSVVDKQVLLSFSPTSGMTDDICRSSERKEVMEEQETEEERKKEREESQTGKSEGRLRKDGEANEKRRR